MTRAVVACHQLASIIYQANGGRQSVGPCRLQSACPVIQCYYVVFVAGCQRATRLLIRTRSAQHVLLVASCFDRR